VRLWTYSSYLHKSQRRKRGESSQYHQWRITKYHFGERQQVRPLLWNMAVNSKGALKRAVDLCEVCASVAHRRVEASATFGGQNHGYNPPSSLLTWIGPTCFFISSKNKIAATRASFPAGSWNLVIIANRRTHYNRRPDLAVFPAVTVAYIRKANTLKNYSNQQRK
jgi:hypothetical protein